MFTSPKYIAILALFLMAAGIPSGVHAQVSNTELEQSKDQQKGVQVDTEKFVDQIGLTIRYLEFQNLNKADEDEVLGELARTLAGLSREQMNTILARLDAAAKATDANTQERELLEAQARHQEILKSLRGLLTKFDAFKGLDQAAQELDALANAQLEKHLETANTLKMYEEYQELDGSKNQDKVQAWITKKLGKPLALEMAHQSGEQRDLHQAVDNVLKKVYANKEALPEPQQKRVEEMRKMLQDQKVLDNMVKAADKFNAKGYPDKKIEAWKEGSNLQSQVAGELKELAKVLKSPTGKLEALKEAKARLEKAIEEQKGIQDKTDTQAKLQEDKNKIDPKNNDPKANDPKNNDPNIPGLTPLAKNPEKKAEFSKNVNDLLKALDDNNQVRKEVSDQQAKLEFETRDIRNLLEPHVKETAEKIGPAQTAMQQAENALRGNEFEKALPKQNQAAGTLKEAKQAVENMIAKEEKNQADPLAALKNASEKLGEIIKEQKETKQQTQEANNKKQDFQLPFIAGKQQELAKNTDALKNQPLPTTNDVKPELEKAVQAMQQAKNELDTQKGPEAVNNQNKAIKNLEKVQDALKEKIAEIEKRKEDIAKLEDAKNKLGELIKQEGNVAEKSNKLAQQSQPMQPETKQLANKQGELTPQAKNVGKELTQTAPKAAEKVGEATKNMEAAKGELDNNKTAPAAKEATEATAKLKEAEKAVEKALDDLKAKEIADQVAMQQQQPNPTNPAEAAQQLAKAIEQTQKALDDSKQAANQQPTQQPMKQAQPNLAELQKQVADKANDLKVPEANQPANEAAKALEQGNLEKALEQQQIALAKLEDAAKNPMQPDFSKAQPINPGEAKQGEPKQGEPMPGEAKKGQPMPTEAKNNQAKPAEAKAGEPMATPKAGQPMPAEAKNNQAQASEAKQAAQPMAGEPKNAQPMPGEAKAGEPKQGEPKAGQPMPMQAKANEPKAGEPKAGEPKAGQPMAGEPKAGEPKAGQPMAGEPKAGQPMNTQAKAGEPKAGQPQAGEPKAGQPKAGQPMAGNQKPAGQQPMQGQQTASAKQGQAQAGQPKAGEPKAGEAKAGQPMSGQQQAGQAKAGQVQAAQAKQPQAAPQQTAQAPQQGQPQGGPQGQPKGMGQQPGQNGNPQGAPTPAAAQNPTQLAQAQQGLMQATKAAMQSQQATKAAMASLGQAQAQAPGSVAPQLQKAGQQLGQASQALNQGQPGSAMQNQQQALNQMNQALQAMNAALAAMGQPQAQPGQTPTSVASGPPPGQGQPGQGQPGQGQPGQGQPGQGQPGQGQPGQGQPGQGQPGQGQPGQGQPGQGQPGQGKQFAQGADKGKGIGNRIADGSKSNDASQLENVTGEGGFLNLPPRQRQLIQQALSGQVPPEYAAMIQQYYLNIAGGQPAAEPNKR